MPKEKKTVKAKKAAKAASPSRNKGKLFGLLQWKGKK